jgi:hypothetical protein
MSRGRRTQSGCTARNQEYALFNLHCESESR